MEVSIFSGNAPIMWNVTAEDMEVAMEFDYALIGQSFWSTIRLLALAGF